MNDRERKAALRETVPMSASSKGVSESGLRGWPLLRKHTILNVTLFATRVGETHER